MAVGFRELCEFGFVVNVRIGNLEGTRSPRDVGLDITDALDFGQIASDRGGTAPSRHVGHFETDQCDIFRHLRRLYGTSGGLGCSLISRWSSLIGLRTTADARERQP